MTTFPALFRQHVMPEVERLCDLHGVLVGLGVEEFGAAFGAVWRVAHARGGSRLPAHLWDSLLDWVLTRLLERAVAPIEPDGGLAAVIAALPDAIRSGADWAIYRRLNELAGETECRTSPP